APRTRPASRSHSRSCVAGSTLEFTPEDECPGGVQELGVLLSAPGDAGPLPRRFDTLPRKSNQNGAPSESANPVTSRPRILPRTAQTSCGDVVWFQPSGKPNCFTSSTHFAAASADVVCALVLAHSALPACTT